MSSSADLLKLVEAAASRRRVLWVVRGVYQRLQKRIDQRRPICQLSGRCCHFQDYGHRLYVTTLELAALTAQWRQTPTASPPLEDTAHATSAPVPDNPHPASAPVPGNPHAVSPPVGDSPRAASPPLGDDAPAASPPQEDTTHAASAPQGDNPHADSPPAPDSPHPASAPVPGNPHAAPAAACPFQSGKLCRIHSIRPFGCRIFFCDPAAADWQRDQYEYFHNLLKKWHARLNVEYRYLQWPAAMQ